MFKAIRYWLACEVVIVFVIGIVATITAYQPDDRALGAELRSAPQDPNVIVGLDDTPTIGTLPHYRSLGEEERTSESEQRAAEDPNVVRMIAHFNDSVGRYLLARRQAWARNRVTPSQVHQLTSQPMPHNRPH